MEVHPPCLLDLTWPEYLAAPGINNSLLGVLESGPKKFIKALTAERKAASTAKRIGDVFHHLLLCPEEKDKLIDVRPKAWKDWRTDAAQIWRKEMEAAGYTIVTEQEMKDIVGMVNSVRNDPDAGPLFKKGKAEVAAFANDKVTGVLTKARIDWLPDRSLFAPGSPVPIVDLKTTEDSGTLAFQHSVKKFKYYRQAAHYLSSLEDSDKRDVFLIVAVEKEEPWTVVVYQLGEQTIERGRHEMAQLLAVYKERSESGDWTNPKGIQLLEI